MLHYQLLLHQYLKSFIKKYLNLKRFHLMKLFIYIKGIFYSFAFIDTIYINNFFLRSRNFFFIFGHGWAISGEYAQILVFAAVIKFSVSPTKLSHVIERKYLCWNIVASYLFYFTVYNTIFIIKDFTNLIHNWVYNSRNYSIFYISFLNTERHQGLKS